MSATTSRRTWLVLLPLMTALGCDADPVLRNHALSGARALPSTSQSRSRRSVLLASVAGLLVIMVRLMGARFTGLLEGTPGRPATPNAAAAVPLTEPVEVTPLVDSSPVTQRGETFLTRELQVTFSRGRIYLSGDPPPASPFTVDDGLRMDVTRPDGTIATWSHDFNTSCIRNEAVPAQDVTTVFQPGVNRVSITLYDICGANKGTEAPIWLVNRE